MSVNAFDKTPIGCSCARTHLFFDGITESYVFNERQAVGKVQTNLNSRYAVYRERIG